MSICSKCEQKVLPVEAGIREAAALAQSLALPVALAATTPLNGVETPAADKDADGPKTAAAAEARAKAAAAAKSAAAAAAAAGARLEPGQYASVADALGAAEAGDTVVLCAGHHWEVG